MNLNDASIRNHIWLVGFSGGTFSRWELPGIHTDEELAKSIRRDGETLGGKWNYDSHSRYALFHTRSEESANLLVVHLLANFSNKGLPPWPFELLMRMSSCMETALQARPGL